MRLWSSPFPCSTQCCDLLQELGYSRAEFPGPPETLVIFNSPDQVLLSWASEAQCDGAEMARLEEGYRAIQNLRSEGRHIIKAEWQLSEELGCAPISIPTPDGITATLLIQQLHQTPEVLADYMKLEPAYVQRLFKVQSKPSQLITHWLLLQHEHAKPDPQQQEAKRLQAMFDQVTDQHRRIRLLLSDLIQRQRRSLQ